MKKPAHIQKITVKQVEAQNLSSTTTVTFHATAQSSTTTHHRNFRRERSRTIDLGSMGRGKVVLRRIEDKKVRKVTFSKRRQGVFKKVRELSVLCSADVAVLVTSSTRRPYLASHPAGLEDIIQRYHEYKLANPTKDGSEHQPDNMQTIHRYFVNLNARIGDLCMSELVQLEAQMYEILKEVIQLKNQMIEKSNDNLNEMVKAAAVPAEKEIMDDVNAVPLIAPLLE